MEVATPHAVVSAPLPGFPDEPSRGRPGRVRRSAARRVTAGEVAVDHGRADGAARAAVGHAEGRAHDVAGGVQAGDGIAVEVEDAGVRVDPGAALRPER